VLSRNESFSLVTLEAGLLKKPVLCFEGSGGSCEIVDFKKEFLVPYADTDAMCERINQLIEKPGLCTEMGNYLYERVVTNYTIEKSAHDLLAVFNTHAQ
jgi:glycosyltransferase involved in cell wall biosynthesis